MTSLIIQDSFAPYYVGRDDKSGSTAKSSTQKSGGEKSADERSRAPQQPESRAQAEIVLPVSPLQADPVRRERRAAIISH